MSNSFGVACPACEKVLKIKNRDLIGKRIVCPKCENAFRIEADKVQKVVSKSSATASSSGQTQPSPKPKRKVRKKPASKPAAAATNTDDEWLSALSEVEESGSTLDESEFGGALPPVKRGHGAPKPKKKREVQEPIPGDSYYQSSSGGGGEGGLFGLGIFGGLIGGIIAGVIGALIWGGVTYYSGYEFSILAWGIGAFVGFGVLLGAQGYAGLETGIMALVLANLSIFGGKVFASYIIFSALFGAFGDLMDQDFVATDDYMISIYADDIVYELEDQGKTVVFPRDDVANFDFSKDYPAEDWQTAKAEWEGMTEAEKQTLKTENDAEPNGNESYYISIVAMNKLMEASLAGEEVDWPERDFSTNYPTEIWQQASEQWAALTPEEQEAQRKQEEGEDVNLSTTSSLISFTWSTLGPLDGLWVLLASFTAFRIGANEHEVD